MKTTPSGLLRGCGPCPARIDEYEDLVALLQDHAEPGRHDSLRLARIVACACLGEHHLWQDLGLPSRGALGHLLREHFPALHARNVANMRWKKFFYKQLCERAGVNACRAPSCGECRDYATCFGPEEAAAVRSAKPLSSSAGEPARERGAS